LSLLASISRAATWAGGSPSRTLHSLIFTEAMIWLTPSCNSRATRNLVIHLHRLARTQNHKNVRQRRLVLDPPANLQAADIRQPHVQQDQIRQMFPSQFKAFPTGHGLHDFIAIAPQAPGKQITNHAVIIHNKN
jgi:hypothetical protein